MLRFLVSGSSWFKIRQNVVPESEKNQGRITSRMEDLELAEQAATNLVSLSENRGYKMGVLDALENIKYALDILENSGSGFEWRALIDHLIEDVQQ